MVGTHDLAIRPTEDADAYASLIYLVRDPFDAIWCELIQQYSGRDPTDIRFTPTYLAEKLRAWDRHIRYWTFHVQVMGERHAMVVRYEDLDQEAYQAMAAIAAIHTDQPAECAAERQAKHPASCPTMHGREELMARCENTRMIEDVMSEIAESLLRLGYRRR